MYQPIVTYLQYKWMHYIWVYILILNYYKYNWFKVEYRVGFLVIILGFEIKKIKKCKNKV
jgi:hypothetical protein